MAVVAEVCFAPAVPRRHRAAELTFPLEEVLAVGGTLLCHGRATARAAHEVRRVERLIVFTRIAAPLPREVGMTALGAHEVRVPVHGVALAVIVPLRRGVGDLFGFGESFEFETLERLLLDNCF